MPTPSLLIVPSRWKTGNPGKLYSQIPTNGNGDFNVTGVVTGAGNIGTRVNNLGYIEPITTSGTPRLDYYTSSGIPGCPALLVEPAATNFARWVNQMTGQDTPPAGGGMTITTGSTDFLAPDGTSGSITKYVGGAASGTNQYAYYSGGGIIFTASGQHTFSLFVKRGATNPLTFCALSFVNYTGGIGTSTSYFNLASGTALTAGASVQDYGNGWYRLISAPYTIASGDLDGQLLFWMAEGNGDLSWPASGALNLTAYTWGAQVETGSVATSYIPTTTGTVSRAAEVISVSGAVSGSIGQTEGTVYVELDTRNLYQGIGVINIRSSTTNYVMIYMSNALRRYSGLINAAGTQVTVGETANGLAAGVYKIALAYKANDCAFYVNGTLVGSTSQATMPTGMTEVNLAQDATSPTSRNFNDRIRAAALYTTRLTNADLMLLTMPGNNTYLPQAVWDNYLSRPGNAEVPDCLYTRHADLLDV